MEFDQAMANPGTTKENTLHVVQYRFTKCTPKGLKYQLGHRHRKLEIFEASVAGSDPYAGEAILDDPLAIVAFIEKAKGVIWCYGGVFRFLANVSIARNFSRVWWD